MSEHRLAPPPFATWTERVLHHLRLDGDSVAIVQALPDGTIREISRTQLLALVTGAVERITALELPLSPVPALLSARPDSISFLLAGAITGRPLAPLSPRMTVAELRACVDAMPGPVILAETSCQDVAEQVAEATGRRVVLVDGTPPSTAALTANPSAADTAFVMHTSGTTGLPKKVLVPEDRLGRRSDVNGHLLSLRSGDRLVTAAMFHHVGALGNIAVGLGNGAAVVMLPAFSVDAWRSLAPVAPTHAVLVPSIIEILLQEDALALESLRVIGYGGSPIRPETMRRIQSVLPGTDFVNLFGQTEGSPISYLSSQDHRRAADGEEHLLTSVGRAAPESEIHLHDPDPAGVGEVWSRSLHSFVVDADGWQHTGDLGRIDAEGYLYLVGRRGDKIIRGGENVFPIEVERILDAHPDVHESAVIGVPDQRLGETIKALIVPSPGATLSFEELRTHCRASLAGFKVPALWEEIDSLPRNANGKVVRRDLIARESR